MALYDVAGWNPAAADLVVDTQYTALAATAQALFLQDGDEALHFIRPVAPEIGATGVSRGEAPSAHFLGTYADLATIKLKMSGVELARTVAATTGGYLAIATGVLLRPEIDGLVHLSAEGTETAAGAESVSWTVTPGQGFPLRHEATFAIPIAAGIMTEATFAVLIRLAMASEATFALTLRAVDRVTSEATFRFFVGEFFLALNGAMSANIAEVFERNDGSMTAHIRGWVTHRDGSMTAEILGPHLNVDGSMTVNVAEVYRMNQASMSAEIAILEVNPDGSMTIAIWGEASDDKRGRLVFRVTTLTAAEVAAMEDQGFTFNFS